MGRLFGQSIDQDVVKQLEQRESILGRNGIRSTEDLRFLTQKSAWIRMISGVNVLDNEGNFTNQAAKSLILSGGALKVVPTENPSTSSPYSGYKAAKINNLTLAKNGSTNFSSTERGRYSRTDNLGVRPEPGITSFSITHKGRYGAVRAAEIGFTVWSREDLDAVQDLHLRPGMSLIVEWGNSIYVDNEGSIEEMSLPNEFDRFFFDTKTSKIIDIINNHRKETNYNYDGFMGLVSNFSWSFREDGGYDCTVSIISRGAIIETLALRSPTTITVGDNEDISDELDLKLKRHKKSILHSFIETVNDSFPRTIENQEPYKFTFNNLINPTIKPGGAPIIKLKELLDGSLSEEQKNFICAGFKSTENSVEVYASLRTILALVDISFNITSPNGEKIVNFNTSTESFNKFRSFTGHFSLNPFICILPKEPSSSVSASKIELTTKGLLKSLLQLHSFLNEDDFKNKLISVKVDPPRGTRAEPSSYRTSEYIINSTTRQDDILDIYVNLNLVKNILDDYYYKEDEEYRVNVLDFLRSLLNKIQSALGNLNSFDIHYDELLNEYSIVDRDKVIQDTILKDGKKENSIATVNLTGLKSTVSSVNIQTKITSELSSQIAISAQGSRYLTNNSNLQFIDWNRDIRDRFKTTTSTTVSNSSENKDENTAINNISKQQEWLRAVSKAYDKLNSKNYFLGFLPDLEKRSAGEASDFGSLYSQGSIYFKELYYKQKITTGTPENRNNKLSEIPEIGEEGLIPLDLQFTLDGIAGINIAQIFKVGDKDNPSNILPSKYDRYGFIVTAVDHTLENSKWLTTVRGITFKIP